MYFKHSDITKITGKIISSLIADTFAESKNRKTLRTK